MWQRSDGTGMDPLRGHNGRRTARLIVAVILAALVGGLGGTVLYLLLEVR